jgi:hypothetical protein
MPDWWEIYYFGSTNHGATGDYESDGLSNLDEYIYGADPTNIDSDADGMGDGTEVLYGNDPTNPGTYASLPFEEGFETDTVGTGDIDGSNGWSVSAANIGIAQTDVVYAASQALEIVATSSTETVTHYFGAAGEDMVWSDFHAQPVQGGLGGSDPDFTAGETVAFYVNEDGQLVVYDQSVNSGLKVPPRGTFRTCFSESPFSCSNCLFCQLEHEESCRNAIFAI